MLFPQVRRVAAALSRSVIGICGVALPALAFQGFPAQSGEVDRKHDPGHEPSHPASTPALPLLEREHLLGDLAGARTDWGSAGVDFEVLISSEASRVLAGGLDTSRTLWRSLVGAQCVLDAQRLWGIEGGELLVLAQYQDGDDGVRAVGDAQGYSNIDADTRAQISKLWWYQEFVDAGLWAKLGKIDVNSDFAYTEHGAPFLNSSLGYSPTLVGFPTYPDPSFGGQLVWEMLSDWRISAGVFDGAGESGYSTGSRGPSTLFGAPDDVFAIAELACAWRAEGGARPGRVGVGAWHHSAQFQRFDGGDEQGTQGLYVVADQTLLGAPDADRQLGCFAQFATADEDTSELSRHLGFGVTWRGCALGLGLDLCGVALSSVEFSDAAGFRAERETVLELFASFVLAPWLRLKPDLQFIDDPGGIGAEDAWVATLRTTWSM